MIDHGDIGVVKIGDGEGEGDAGAGEMGSQEVTGGLDKVFVFRALVASDVLGLIMPNAA
jgi:hypothetical protein